MRGKLKNEVIYLLRERGEFLTTTDFHRHINLEGRHPQTLGALLAYLVKKGVIVRVFRDSRAYYGLPDFCIL